VNWRAALRRDAALIGYQAVALGSLLVGVKLRSPLFVVVDFVVFAALGIAVRRRIAPADQVPMPAPLWIVGAALVALGVAVAVVGWNSSLSFRMYLVLGGLGEAYISIGQVLADLRHRTRRPGDERPPLAFLAVTSLAFVVGAVWILVSPSPWALAPMGVGLFVAPAGLNVLSGRFLARFAALRAEDDGHGTRADRSSRRRFLVLLGGLGLGFAVVGLAWLSVAGVSGTYLTVIAVFFVALLGAIASDTDLDVLIVVALLAVVGSLAPTGVGLDREVTPAASDHVLVAIGDSYMSGEGARQFYEGTNTVGSNECRRAPTAYSVLLVESSPTLASVVFDACSGARAVDVSPGDARQKQIPVAQSTVASLGLKVDAVVISMGGNDSHFSEVAATCLGPGDCTEVAQQWLDRLPETASRLATFYRDIDAAFPGVPKLVIPYPVPIAPDGCSWSGFSRAEHRFLAGFTHELDAVVRQEAARAGFSFLATNETLFEQQHVRICDHRDPNAIAVNFLARNPADGFAIDRLNPQNWLHNSLHPNKLGHELIAAELAPFFAATPTPLPTPEPLALATWTPRTLDQISGVSIAHCGGSTSPDYCPASPTSWVVVQLGLAAVRAAVPFVLVSTGAWLVWLVVLSTLHRRRSRRGPGVQQA
jgi:lysophospholipase L1-like esterase